MNKSAKNIIKTLLLSATVALANQAKADSKATSLSLDLGLNPNNSDIEIEKDKQKIIKNVYKIQRNGDYKLIAGHRSHSSHRSSRSGHYSHSSSSHSSHSSHRSANTGSHYSHSSSSSYGGGSSSYYSAPAKTPATYSLGDRTLSNGLYGNDVDELIPYLVRYSYIRSTTGLIKKGGYYVYDANVANAVKHFQKDAGLTADGKITSSQLTTLKGWDIDKTTIPLGFRELTTSTSGYDVDELVRLLTTAGYAPDPVKLQKSGDHYVFTEDIQTAIKVFQAYNGIKPTGELDATTLSTLKSKGA
jgi:peptidoglycan hydrolase-like protein with peptidoglycan-binding domain